MSALHITALVVATIVIYVFIFGVIHRLWGQLTSPRHKLGKFLISTGVGDDGFVAFIWPGLIIYVTVIALFCLIYNVVRLPFLVGSSVAGVFLPRDDENWR